MRKPKQSKKPSISDNSAEFEEQKRILSKIAQDTNLALFEIKQTQLQMSVAHRSMVESLSGMRREMAMLAEYLPLPDLGKLKRP